MKIFNFNFNIKQGWLFLRSLDTYWKNLAMLIGILDNALCFDAFLKYIVTKP